MSTSYCHQNNRHQFSVIAVFATSFGLMYTKWFVIEYILCPLLHFQHCVSLALCNTRFQIFTPVPELLIFSRVIKSQDKSNGHWIINTMCLRGKVVIIFMKKNIIIAFSKATSCLLFTTKLTARCFTVKESCTRFGVCLCFVVVLSNFKFILSISFTAVLETADERLLDDICK